MSQPRFTIDDLSTWVEMRFDTAGGPGGQHVNKVSTRATLLFDYRTCSFFTDAQRDRITRRYATRLTRDGRLRVVAGQSRSQSANRATAEARLLDLLEQALHVPKKRRATRPTAGSRRRRLADKKRRGETKRNRQSRPSPDD